MYINTGECEIYLNEELKEEMIKLDSMETAEHVYDDSMENCVSTRTSISAEGFQLSRSL